MLDSTVRRVLFHDEWVLFETSKDYNDVKNRKEHSYESTSLGNTMLMAVINEADFQLEKNGNLIAISNRS